MSNVSTWHLFAYMREDDTGDRDHHRMVSDWRMEDALRWARHRGYDTIMFTRIGEEEFVPSVSDGIQVWVGDVQA